MLLILAHPADAGARAVAAALAPRLGSRVQVLAPEWLATAQWSQRIDGRGRSRTRLSWAGGATLDSPALARVWNRIRGVPLAAFRHSRAGDQDYAGAEMQALVAGWLAELGPHVEPEMRRHATLSPCLHRLQWAAAAGRCGLALASGAAAPETVTVLRTPAGYCGPPLPPALAAACNALADALGLGVLELGFSGPPPGLALCRVEPHPALVAPGHAAAVANWLARWAAVEVDATPHTKTEVEVGADADPDIDAGPVADAGALAVAAPAATFSGGVAR